MSSLDLSTSQEFRPFAASRRGELYAWILTLAVILVLLFVPQLPGLLPTVGIFFAIFFSLSAILISLNNWMERGTVLHLDETGVAFRNGLRNVHLVWDQIARIEVTQRNVGRRVHVIGEQAHFAFYTQGAVKLGNRVSEPTGFEQGEAILDTILERASLTQTTASNADVYYYARD